MWQKLLLLPGHTVAVSLVIRPSPLTEFGSWNVGESAKHRFLN